MKTPLPIKIKDGIAMVNKAIAAEKKKDYALAKSLYIAAASKIIEGSNEYPTDSAKRTAARKKASQYADRADKLSRLQKQQSQQQLRPQQQQQQPPQQQQQPQQPPQQQPQKASASDIYRVPPSQMYHSAPTLQSSSSGRRLAGLSDHTEEGNNPPRALSESLLGDTTGNSKSSFTSFLTKRCLVIFSVVFLAGALITILVVAILDAKATSNAPSPSGPPTPTPLSPSAAKQCGATPKWQLWKGMVDKSAWYDYIDINVPVSKLPTSGILSNGEPIELEIDIDMGGTSKRSSQLYANPEFQQYYDNLIREWNPSASTRTGTVDGCGFPKGEQAVTSTPELEDFKREKCMYEDFNTGLNLNVLRPLEQKACCERGPPESGVGCWKWSNGTTYPKGCKVDGSGYKFNGNIGVEEMEVEYPHNGKPLHKNVLRLTSRNIDADICDDPFVKPADKLKLCHKVVKSSGLIQTNDMYASARFDIVAKVPADRGLVWALWTFHQELHVPGKLGCDNYTCYADGFPGGKLGNETTLNDNKASNNNNDNNNNNNYNGEDEEGNYIFTPQTKWDDCCDTVDCCLDPTPPPLDIQTSFLRTVEKIKSDQCAIPQNKRISNSTCQCCEYNLDNNKYPHHKYNAPCCIASKQKIGPCTGPSLCDKDYYTDLRTPKCNYAKDPQWLRNASMVSWLNKINHEIDIEIPASCYDTEVCGVTAGQCGLDIEDGKWCNTTVRDNTGCVGQFNTMNANNYRLTTTGGTGHAYSNMCLKTHKKKKTVIGMNGIEKENEDGQEQEPFMLAGDGKFHKYTIDWHTGGTDCEARVDFYVDDILLATNNVMVPTRGSRFVFGSWGPEKGAATSASGKFNNEWTNFPDFWGNGQPGDGKSYLSHVYVSEVKITPHNEENDIMYPATLDRKDGCDKIFGQEKDSCHQHWETDEELGWKDQKIPAAMGKGAAPGSMSGTCV